MQFTFPLPGMSCWYGALHGLVQAFKGAHGLEKKFLQPFVATCLTGWPKSLHDPLQCRCLVTTTTVRTRECLSQRFGRHYKKKRNILWVWGIDKE